jgi:subtilase family serine protease
MGTDVMTVLRSNRLAALLAAFALSACSNAMPGMAPGSSHAPATAPAHMRPAEGANALPGEGANALPGATLPCVFNPAQGQANCTVAINTNVPPLNDPTEPASLIPGLHPTDLTGAYALPSQSAGQVVAIVDAYDDPTAEYDMGVYRTAFGLKPCTLSNGCFRKVDEHGGTSYPATNTAWSDEIALDLDMVSAACPNCAILLVEANSASIDDLGSSVDEAVALGARVVSNSYYAFEWSGETSEDKHYHHNGTAITVSSGDAAETFYPAASPFVTSVGGTTLEGSAGAWTEAGWKFAGGGCTAYEPKPGFQSGVQCSTRSSVDVAAIADPQTGVATFATSAGGWIVAGGTSVGAPLIAAAYALSGNLKGPGYSYGHRNAFHDVLPAGYDFRTGLGTPNGVTGL